MKDKTLTDILMICKGWYNKTTAHLKHLMRIIINTMAARILQWINHLLYIYF